MQCNYLNTLTCLTCHALLLLQQHQHQLVLLLLFYPLYLPFLLLQLLLAAPSAAADAAAAVCRLLQHALECSTAVVDLAGKGLAAGCWLPERAKSAAAAELPCG